ncbi:MULTISPECIES: site-specific integrase [Hyphomonadaceae]|uniref:site-specific integrase n=1 Tax=Hyphomonadaceae TaxID=69657 RepID=UPI001F5C3177|nr:site-specific integrase [Hyphomonas sp. KY3]
MKHFSLGTKFLKARGGWWHYVRRVPQRFKDVDKRCLIQVALRTQSLEVAMMRRNGLAEADDALWSSLALQAQDTERSRSRAAAERHRAAVARAMAEGFVYRPVEEVATQLDIEEIIDRLRKVDRGAEPGEEKAEALLGGAPEEKDRTTVSEAFELYVSKIAFDDQYNKSDAQRKSWEKRKQVSIDYFIEREGDIPLLDITRDVATRYRDWWQSRMLPQKDGSKPFTPNTVNRHIGNMRSLYLRYFKYRGQTDVEDPFRGFFFAGKSKVKRASFSDEWVRTKILAPGMFDELRLELRVIIYLLIETGARLSEIVNLRPDDIQLDHDIPHIIIRPEQNRELKTSDSEREIPLVGVALPAMKLCPNGFEHYYDRNTLVSANLMKAFKQRELLPSKDHVIYSLRHSFEDRMLEGNLDYGLRCALMGHKNNRPEYGQGGSLNFRRDQLLKIAHPFPDGLTI